MATDPTTIQPLIDRTADDHDYATRQLQQELAALIRNAEEALRAVEAGQSLPGGYDFQTGARRVQEADTARVSAARLLQALNHTIGA
jgi:hypothetical protein